MEGMTLEKLQVIIEAYTKPYRDELEKAKKQTSTTANHIERQTARIASSFRKIAGIVVAALSITAIVAFGKSCIDLGSQLAEVDNVIQQAVPSMEGRIDSFAKNAIQQFGMSEIAAKRYTGVFASMARGFKFSEESAASMGITLTGLAADVASFYDTSQSEAFTKLKSVFTGETETLKDLGIVMTQTALDAYAMENGYGKTTKSMSEAEKVALRYAFVQEKLRFAQGDFARTSGSWANQVRILSEQFNALKATIGQGLINAFTPVITVINTILAKLQTLAAYFKAFTAAIFGDASGGGEAVTDSLESAAGTSGAVADNMGSAAKSAKEMIKQLAGFDELNNLSSGNRGGSSGGGAGGSLGDLDLGMDNIQSQADVISNKIIDAFKAGDYYSVGAYIGACITDALRQIDWNSAYDSARNFGTGFAQFLNGLISPDLFWEVGKTIAAALNTALYAALAFGRTFDWVNFGLSIATGINGFFSTFDFSALGSAASVFAVGLFDMIATAIENTDWYLIGQKIGEFLIALDWNTILADLGRIIIDAISAAIEINAGMINAAPIESAILLSIAGFKFAGVGKSIVNGIKTALGVSGITLKGLKFILTGFTVGGMGGPAFEVIIVEILGWLNDAVDKLLPDWVTNFFGNLLAGLLSGAVAGSWIPGLGTLAGAIVGGIIGALNGIKIDGESVLKIISNKIFNFDFANSLLKQSKGFFEKAFAADNFLDIGANIIAGIASGITAGFVALGEPIADLFQWIVDGICNVFGIHSPAKNMEPYGENILRGIIEGFKDTFGEWTETLNDWYNNHIAPWFTAQKWKELYKSIKEQLKSTWDETVGAWKTDISNWWSKEVSPWFTLDKWKSIMSKVPDAFKTTFQNAISGARELFNKFISWLNEKMKFQWDNVEIAGKTIIEGGSFQLFQIPQIPAFATGGFPDSGQLFIANEAGPELVGRIGNRTAVANNDQITDGIAMAVSEANTEQNQLLREQNDLLRAILAKPGVDKEDVVDLWKAGATSFRSNTGKQLGAAF